MPIGWRAQDVLGLDDGYLPLNAAAELMGAEPETVREMAQAGLLEALDDGGQWLVRPALVSVLKVKQG